MTLLRTVRLKMYLGRIFILPVFFIGGLAVAAPPLQNDKDFVEISRRIDKENVQEECLILLQDQILEYRFLSDQPLQFNLHYHDKAKGRIIYLFGPSSVTMQPPQNRYTALATQIMCLMWQNKGETAAQLQYSHRILGSE